MLTLTNSVDRHVFRPGIVKHGVASYAYLDDLFILSLQVDESQSDLAGGVTSHTQTVYLLLPEGMSSKDLMSGARVRVSSFRVTGARSFTCTGAICLSWG
jgi:hypothetical protein